MSTLCLTLPRLACIGMIGATLIVSGGCPVTQSLPSQAPIQERIEPHSQATYLLYVPSIYSDEQSWPLVIACHGTWPYDTAVLQMREWAKFAEYQGILIVAPSLVSSKGDFPPPPDEQKKRQDADDQNILAIVAELKRQYNIAEEQVFLTGWSAGAFPILHTGLKHPDIFRALFIRQGNFDERFMDVPDSLISKWQPIKIVYGRIDTMRDQTRKGIAWLRDKGLWVEEEEISGVHRRVDPRFTWRFFKKVITERPWIRIRIQRIHSATPFTVRFSLDAVPKVLKLKWLFGDGSESYDASPIHTYPSAGRYQVRVNAALTGGKTYSRTKVIHITSTARAN